MKYLIVCLFTCGCFAACVINEGQESLSQPFSDRQFLPMLVFFTNMSISFSILYKSSQAFLSIISPTPSTNLTK